MIDLRDHAVTRALGGSEFAYYSTPSSECERLYKILDEAEQMWTNGDHNRSILSSTKSIRLRLPQTRLAWSRTSSRRRKMAELLNGTARSTRSSSARFLTAS